MKLLITHTNQKYLYKNQDLHTQFGYIKKDEIEKSQPGTELKTNTGKSLFVIEASFIDLYEKIKRQAQIIPLKDVGAIIATSGINKDSIVIDAGSGSGALACLLAHLVKHVYTYDIREDHLKVTLHNIEFLGLQNVTAKLKDIYNGIDETNGDLVTLDVPEPWKALNTCCSILHPGGFIMSYSPSIPQVSDFVEALQKTPSLIYIKTIELIEREWEFQARKIRPKSRGIGHSGFLSFARKV